MSTIRNGKIVAALATAAAGRFKVRAVMSASKALFSFALFVCADLVVVADPKVGCTIAFSDSHAYYQSNAHFRDRPIASQMIKDGIDLCLYNGWKSGKVEEWKSGKVEESVGGAVRSLKQFNSIWLITEHEGMCPFPAPETVAALKAYVGSGGGLVVCFSPGRYPEAEVDAYWTEVMAAFGAELLHEEIFNPETDVKVDKRRHLFYTSDFVKHPVTEGVPGLWLADRSGGTWGSVAVKYSPDWQVVVTGGKGSLSRPKNRRTNEIEEGKVGVYTHDAPIVAVRAYGKGRIVFIASHKDSCGWMYGIDRWPNYPERSNFNGKPSDMVTLVENALRWTAEPSLGAEGFVKHFKPVEPVIPPYQPQPDFGLREREKPSYPATFNPANLPIGARGLVGVRSSHSDGASSVAEYVAAAKAAGLNFLVFCDPLEKLTAEKLAQLRADCAANSSEGFYCCPGVEYVDSSDLVWGLWHDKVEFPDPKPLLLDGGTYRRFDGRKVLQRNNYGGHQNLFRGVLLNMKRVAEIGNDLINLAYFNAVTPKVFDGEKLVYDNDPEYLRVGHNLHRAATVAYVRVRRAADVAQAARTAMTCGDNLAAIRNWANAKGGWGGQDAGEAAHLQAVYGSGAEIHGFDLVRASGTDVTRVALRVTCPAGVAEVALRDGDRRVLARFDAKGEKDFQATFDFLRDRQMVLILTAKGRDGSEAVSNSKWLCYYHAGMFRCGDNSNLLSQNPNVIESLHWDDVMVPPQKMISAKGDHFMMSEGRSWDAYYTLPSRNPSTRCWGAYSRIPIKGFDYPSEKIGMPSSRSVSTLNQPNVVSIFDQYQGDFIMEPTHSEKNSTYANCSLVPKIGEGRYWRRHHRVYQFVDRHDGWWRAVYKQESPGYRGGYTIVEGEISVTEDFELARPIDLVWIQAANPAKPADVYARKADVFRADSYIALHAMDKAWYGFFGLAGSDDLHAETGRDGAGLRTTLQLGEKGRKLRKGDTLRYRFAVGSFVENPMSGAYCEWFARMMNGEGFVHEGAEAVNGIVELTATENRATLTAGSTWFIQNYPVRIKGLADNGCAVMTDGDRIVRPLAFCGRGVPAASEPEAYAEIPLEERKTWTFLNLFVADDPALRFTYVPALPGHEKETVEIFNATDRAITSRVRDVRTGATFEVTVPARGMIVRPAGAEVAHSFFRKGDVWVLSGDSITHNDFYRQTVMAALDHFHPGHGIRSMNKAVWGQLTREASGQGLDLRPSVVTIMLGMNNVIHRDYPATCDFTADAAAYAETIRAQVKSFQKVGARVVLLKPTLTDETEFSYFAVAHTRAGLVAYGKALEKVAAEEGCGILDFADDFELFKPAMPETATLIPDGVHPYGWGQYALARALIHHFHVERPLAGSDAERMVDPTLVTPGDFRIVRAKPFLADGETPSVLVTAPRDCRAKVRWTLAAEGKNGPRVGRDETVELKAGVATAVPLAAGGAPCLPARLGTVTRVLLTVEPGWGEPRVAVVDFARTRVYDMRGGRVSGKTGPADWTMFTDGSDLWMTGRVAVAEWPARKPAEADIWMNSGGMNGLKLMWDFRPLGRFAEQRFDHDVNAVEISVLEKPWAVNSQAWINRRVQSCLMTDAVRTPDGYAFKLGFRGRVNDYTRFDIRRHDVFGCFLIFDTCENGQIRCHVDFDQLYGPEAKPRVNPEFRLNQTAVFDLKGVLGGATETTTMGVFGL